MGHHHRPGNGVQGVRAMADRQPSAQLNQLRCDAGRRAGNIYIADEGKQRVRLVSTTEPSRRSRAARPSRWADGGRLPAHS